ncbi:MAG: transposase [Gammaproteobacteria bacterium]|nr:transposase [Gammaproteobacteria bacterium]
MGSGKRYLLQGETYFISLLGHDGNICFFDDACYDRYLTQLTQCLGAFQVQLHSFVLLPNEIHLLMTSATPTGIPGLMKLVSDAYVRYYNNRFERSGTIWKGKFKSSLIKGNDLVLECQKYIELAPVRAGLVSFPGEYWWSAFCINAFGGHGAGVTMHDQYRNFGKHSPNRFQHYRNFIAKTSSETEQHLFEHRLSAGFPLAMQVYGARRVKAVKRCHLHSGLPSRVTEVRAIA